MIKFHPNTNTTEMDNILSRFEINNECIRVIHSEIDPAVILRFSDIIISQDSTMLVQASYLGKPVLIMDPQEIRMDSPYALAGAGQFVKTPTDINMFLEKMTSKTGAPQSQNNFVSMGFLRNGTKNITERAESLLTV